MIREIVSKAFNSDDPTPVNVVRETYDSGAIVEYPLPSPRIVLTVDKPAILADGADEALLSAVFEICSLVENDLAWSRVVPIGDVTFTINLRPTAVSIDAEGKALLALSTTVAGTYHVKVSFAGYGDTQTVVEAMV